MPELVILKTLLVFLMFVFIVFCSRTEARNNKYVIVSLWIICLFVIFMLTLLRNPTLSEKTAILIPFRSYYSVFTSNWTAHGKYVLRAILANIILFLPVGAMVFVSAPKANKKKLLIIVFAVSALLSVGIELVQYRTMIGTFETDDIIHNILGGIIGCLITLKADKSAAF